MQKAEDDEPFLALRKAARIESLPQLIEPVRKFASGYLDEERMGQVELVLEEALVNIFNYAYPERRGDVMMNCRVVSGCLVILLEDEGIPFSIDKAEPPRMSDNILERKIGGLGVHLIKSFSDGVGYRRLGKRNILELRFVIHPMEGRP